MLRHVFSVLCEAARVDDVGQTSLINIRERIVLQAPSGIGLKPQPPYPAVWRWQSTPTPLSSMMATWMNPLRWNYPSHCLTVSVRQWQEQGLSRLCRWASDA